MAGEIRVPAETWDTMRRNTEAVARLVVQLQTDIERERGVYMARIAVLEREREELRGELTATTAERDHLRDVAIPEHRERIAELERERDEARAALAAEGELSAERERSRRLVEQRERNAVEVVESIRKALGDPDFILPEVERLKGVATAEPHLVGVARLAASLSVDEDAADPVDRSGEPRRVISRRAWQRKPVTHEWGYVGHYERAGELVGWTIGEGSVVDGDWCMAMSRPIEPTEASKRGDA